MSRHGDPCDRGGAGRSGRSGRSARSGRIPLVTGWLFGALPEPAAAAAWPLEESQLEAVVLPHTVTALSWRDWEPASWEGSYLYRNRFASPQLPPGWRTFLDFAGVMTCCQVSLNGHAFPVQLGGYRSFALEATGLLCEAGNVLDVVVDAGFVAGVPPNRAAPETARSVDFFQPDGLYGEVALRAVPSAYVEELYARPLDVLDAGKRRVAVECTLDVSAPSGAGGPALELIVELRESGTVLAAASVAVPADAARLVARAVLEVPGPVRLWDLGDPHLYEVRARLGPTGASHEHEHGVRVGFREARFEPDGFFLNGRRVQLFGLNRHHFFPFAGAAMGPRVQRRDAEILRNELNCTMVRCSHYPQADAFLAACDELGLLVFEEVAGWGHIGGDGYKQLVLRDVEEMVRRHRNHPSIVVWGTRLNETGDDLPLYRRTHALARRLDPDRATAGVKVGERHLEAYVEELYAQNDYSSLLDEFGTRMPELEAPPGDRPYLVTEAVGTLSGPARYYRRDEPQVLQQGQALAHARVHELAARDERFCGLLGWSGFDYPSGHGNQHRGVKHTGVADLFRVPKPGAAIYRSQVDPASRAVIEPAFYWDFGPTSSVAGLDQAMVCSNLDRLELFVGGAHHATLHPDRSGFAHLAYPPSFTSFSSVEGARRPELRIEGYLGERLALERRFSSDEARDRLAIEADDDELLADGVDAIRVVLRAVDCYGAARPYVHGELQLGLRGPAVLVGDNPLAFGEAGGVAAVWLRSLPGAAGDATLTASHPSLGTANATVSLLLPPR